MPEETNTPPEEGQGVDVTPSTPTEQDVTPSEPFFKYSLPTGEEQIFQTQEELEKGMRDSFFMRSDYTQKSQKNADFRRDLESREKKLEEDIKLLTEQRKKWEDYDELIQSRPDVQKLLDNAFKSGPDANTVYDRSVSHIEKVLEPLKQEIEDLKEERKQRQMEDRKHSAMKKLQAKYADFDVDSVNEELNLLQSGELEPLLEILHWSRKGKSLTPDQMEQKLKQKLQQKQGSELLPGGSKNLDERSFKNLKEAREAALADLT